MKGDKTKFQNLNDATQGYVKFGDGSNDRIERKVSILFRCKLVKIDYYRMYTIYQSYVVTSLAWDKLHKMVIGS